MSHSENKLNKALLLKLVVFCTFLIIMSQAIQTNNDSCIQTHQIFRTIKKIKDNSSNSTKILVFSFSEFSTLNNFIEYINAHNSYLHIQHFCLKTKQSSDSIGSDYSTNAILVGLQNGKILEKLSVKLINEEVLDEFIINLDLEEYNDDDELQAGIHKYLTIGGKATQTSNYLQTSISNKNKSHQKDGSHDNINKAKNIGFFLAEKKKSVINYEHTSHLTTNFIDMSSMKKTDDKQSKGTRFLISFALLIVSSLVSFFIVKSSVDWATHSKTELNRFNEAKAKHISEMINEKFNYIRRTD